MKPVPLSGLSRIPGRVLQGYFPNYHSYHVETCIPSLALWAFEEPCSLKPKAGITQTTGEGVVCVKAASEAGVGEGEPEEHF